MEIKSMGEVMDGLLVKMALPADHPDSLTGFERNSDDDGWDIYWGGYGYWILDSDISSDSAIFSWIEHLGGKNWKGMTGQRLASWITAVRIRSKIAQPPTKGA